MQKRPSQPTFRRPVLGGDVMPDDDDNPAYSSEQLSRLGSIAITAPHHQ
jgi:hypothetical protein